MPAPAPSEDNPPIVIHGGSVTIDFDENTFKPNGKGQFSSAEMKISRIEVLVNGEPTTIEAPDGKVTVTIHYDKG